MSVPDVNINTDMSSKKMLIAGGVFVVIVTVALLLYFFVFKKSSTTSTKSSGCMSNQDCKNGYICLNKMCLVPPNFHTIECTDSSDCTGFPNVECKNQKCVAKQQPPNTPNTQPTNQPQTCSSNAECKTNGMLCINSKCVFPECVNDNDCDKNLVCTNNNCVCKNGNDMPLCKYKYIDFKNQIYDAVTPLWSEDARPSTYGFQNIYGCLDNCNKDPNCGGVHVRQTSSDKIMSATDKVAETNTLATPDFSCYIVGTDPGKALGRSSNASDSNGWTLYYKNQYMPF